MFCAPVFTLYLFIARGYLLGTTLLLISADMAAALSIVPGVLTMGALSGLAAAAVPTFALAFPGMLLVTWPRCRRALGTLQALLLSSAATLLTLIVGFAIYFPVFPQMKHEATALRPGTSALTFLSQTVQIGNSLPLSVVLVAVFALAIIRMLRAGRREGAPDGYHTKLATLLIAGSLSYVVIFVAAVSFHLCDSPFARNGLFIAPFLSLSLALMWSGLSKVQRWLVAGATGVNLAAGVLLVVQMAMPGGDPNDYPGARELLPSAASGAAKLAARIGSLDALESTPFFASMPAQPYAEQLHLTQVPLGETDGLACSVGANRPVKGQEIVAVRQGHRYLLCF